VGGYTVFLDANILFSAAYRPGAGLLRLWDLSDVRLLTSSYALEEARRNILNPEQSVRLEGLAKSIVVVPEVSEEAVLPDTLDLALKDRPILAAAIHARASHLLTGDMRHFGAYFGRVIAGVRIMLPGDYLRAGSR
jgi:uncharacterized protein